MEVVMPRSFSANNNNKQDKMTFFNTDTKTALEAKEAAQWIAYGPVVFQSARVLRNSGILSSISESKNEGITLKEIMVKVKLPLYGVRVLVESGLSIGLILQHTPPLTASDGQSRPDGKLKRSDEQIRSETETRYTLTKTGYYILHDELTRINMDFVHDVCYKGLFSLDKSIETGKPEGLKEFGNWSTIYEALSQLPGDVQRSWFSFDHFFSDDAFPKVLPKVYKNGTKKLLDIGGNTGKWAIASAKFRNDIEVTIMDLPGQLNVAKSKVNECGLSDQVNFMETNVLDAGVQFPKGFDAIWMSQFLDCFSEEQIVSILKRCHNALSDDAHVFVLEPFWDRQRFEIAAFCLQQTSLYFTALANGCSQMYSFQTFHACIREAGFEIEEQVDQIGLSQTLLKLRKASN